MLFSSITFLFMFLPLVLFFYLITKKELHNTVLLISSIILYAWAEPKYLAIMLLTVFTNWLGAILIDKCRYAGGSPAWKSKKFWALIFTVIIDLGFLAYFKYFNFLIENINGIFNSHINILNIVMPIGISFYTFQALSYVIGI